MFYFIRVLKQLENDIRDIHIKQREDLIERGTLDFHIGSLNRRVYQLEKRIELKEFLEEHKDGYFVYTKKYCYDRDMFSQSIDKPKSTILRVEWIVDNEVRSLSKNLNTEFGTVAVDMVSKDGKMLKIELSNDQKFIVIDNEIKKI